MATNPHRRLRKGTRSCIECRRRKSRCIYPDDNTSCYSCLARDIICNDQHGVTKLKPHLPDVDAQLPQQCGPSEGYERSQFQAYSRSVADTSDLTIDSDVTRRVPMMAVLNDSKLFQPFDQFTTKDIPSSSRVGCIDAGLVPSTDKDLMSGTGKEPQIDELCQVLRSALPGYDCIISVLLGNSRWWGDFRQKAYAVCRIPGESISAFALRTYDSTNPAEIGSLIVAYARSSMSNPELLTLADKRIISDFSAAATGEGLECLILLAKSYTDLGQPRKGWMVWRKGIAIAQMMGICTSSSKYSTAWLAIYHGDRFLSLVLGLPYGSHDVNFSSAAAGSYSDSTDLEQQFINRCASVAGRIIDRNTSGAKPYGTETLDLDFSLKEVENLMPSEWWEVPHTRPEADAEIQPLVQRLLQQLCLFHVRMYLYLPHIVSHGESSADENILACIDAARKLLVRYIVLGRQDLGPPLFECKTTSVVAFIAAIILFVGEGQMQELPEVNMGAESTRLISKLHGIFAIEELKKACAISRQCRETLDKLLAFKGGMWDDSWSGETIQIPYFGTLTCAPNSIPRATLDFDWTLG